MSDDLSEKYRALRARLGGLGQVLIGFSGGVDSTLLTAVARDVLGREKVTACLAVGPSLAEQERREALELAALMDVELKTYRATEFDNPALRGQRPGSMLPLQGRFVPAPGALRRGSPAPAPRCFTA